MLYHTVHTGTCVCTDGLYVMSVVTAGYYSVDRMYVPVLRRPTCPFPKSNSLDGSKSE